MYPFLRLAAGLIRHRRAPKLDPYEAHVSQHLIWPWDLDPLGELNNGRTLSLYDIGRVVLAQRTGLLAVVRRERWALAVAGVSVRYRRRLHLFDRVEMRSRLLGWDDKFFYVEQGLWRGEVCASHALLRMALSDRDGLVRTERIRAAMGVGPSQPLPDWAAAWIAAEALRPWPPQVQDGAAEAAAGD